MRKNHCSIRKNIIRNNHFIQELTPRISLEMTNSPKNLLLRLKIIIWLCVSFSSYKLLASNNCCKTHHQPNSFTHSFTNLLYWAYWTHILFYLGLGYDLWPYNNNLQKALPNIITIFFPQILHILVLFPFIFHQTFSNWPKYLSYMLTLNPIRKFYIPFVLKALQEPKSLQETVKLIGTGLISLHCCHDSTNPLTAANKSRLYCVKGTLSTVNNLTVNNPCWGNFKNIMHLKAW